MTRISRRRLRERVYDKLFTLLFEVLAKRETKADFDQILMDLFSPVERIMIAKRVVIIFLLMKNIEALTICDVLKVSTSTVSKFRLVMEKSEGIVHALKRLVENEKIVLFLQGLYNDLFPPGTYGVKKNAWQSKFDFERKKSE